jgi:hypothetical protein
MTFRSNRLVSTLVCGSLAASVISVSAGSAGGQRDLSRLASVREWSAEVIVTSDCDRSAMDGSRTVIHNRIVTLYEFTRPATEKPTLRWSGRASTTYRWGVGTEFRNNRDLEEGSASFEVDAQLDLTEMAKISASRPPGQPFTRRKFLGDSLLETSTANDEPPAAELFEAPLPSEVGTSSGDRMESAYWLLGGVVLTCPARRQWILRSGAAPPKA